MRSARAIMLQGTGSDVGKSLVTASLCRAFARRGLKVLPFKPQNMSNNAAVAAEGGEIGRAQALQARAAGVVPSVHMNPVLLKPQSETAAQVVVHGRVLATAEAADYQTLKARLLGAVLESFDRLAERADLVLVEGAGSPAETNLRANDIANMGFARERQVPVLLVADIERGGVIASLVGTHAVLDAEDRAPVRGYIVNKFRGDVSLFDAGLADITARTGWPSLGVLPWLPAARLLPPEDAYHPVESDEHEAGAVVVAVLMLPRIANSDDLNPLRAEPAVDLRLVPPGEPIPAAARLVVLPGSKATIADLAFLRAQGWDVDMLAHVRRGGHVLGLCGGYQMLGRSISDPHGLEGPAGRVPGLGLLAVDTELMPDKRVRQARGVCASSGLPLAGYEIHLGHTAGPDCARPVVIFDDGQREGATSASGAVRGTYLHGLLGADEYRTALLRQLGVGASATVFEHRVEEALDAMADAVERHLDLDALLSAAG